MSKPKRDRGPEGMLAVSLLCHSVVFAVVASWNLFGNARPAPDPVTYVDLTTLPVAAPQSGTPMPEVVEKAMQAPAAAPPPPAVALPKPTVPVKQAPAVEPTKPIKSPAPQPQVVRAAPAATPVPSRQDEARPSDSEEFNKGLARLELAAAQRRHAETLERLKGKHGPVGMPSATGSEAGSDYASYLQSRLKDALRIAMMTKTAAPQVIASITVSPEGRIVDYRFEKGSGDELFDDAVRRAIAMAGRMLVPPPGGVQFKRVFRFKPEDVAR